MLLGHRDDRLARGLREAPVENAGRVDDGRNRKAGAVPAFRCVDFVQGYHFGRPAAALTDMSTGSAALESAWQAFDLKSEDDDLARRAHIAPYLQAIDRASLLLMQGAALGDACRGSVGAVDGKQAEGLLASGQITTRKVNGGGVCEPIVSAHVVGICH